MVGERNRRVKIKAGVIVATIKKMEELNAAESEKQSSHRGISHSFANPGHPFQLSPQLPSVHTSPASPTHVLMVCQANKENNCEAFTVQTAASMASSFHGMSPSLSGFMSSLRPCSTNTHVVTDQTCSSTRNSPVTSPSTTAPATCVVDVGLAVTPGVTQSMLRDRISSGNALEHLKQSIPEQESQPSSLVSPDEAQGRLSAGMKRNSSEVAALADTPGGKGPTELPRKQARKSSGGLMLAKSPPPPVHSVIDFRPDISAEEWAEVEPREAMNHVLTLICSQQRKRIDCLNAIPRVKYLMGQKLQTFFLQSRVIIQIHREPFVNKPPEAAYAAEALTGASKSLDSKIQELLLLKELLLDPKKKEDLFERLGLAPKPMTKEEAMNAVSKDKPFVAKLAAVGAAATRVAKKFNSGASVAEAAAANISDAFEAVKALAEGIHGKCTQSKVLLAEVNAITSDLPDPVTEEDPRTPRTLFSEHQALGPTPS